MNIRKVRLLSQLLMPLLLLGGAPACVSRLPATAQPTPPGLAATMCGSPNTALGGELVFVGDFVFDLWPYCDEELGPQPGMTEYSAVAALGVSMLWAYNGPALAQRVAEELACEGEPLGEFGFRQSLSTGGSGGYSGGIRLPGRSLERVIQSGKPIACTVQVRAGNNTYSAYLEFAFRDTGAGLELINIAARAGLP